MTGTIDLAIGDNLSLKSITAYREASGTSVVEVDGAPLSILKRRLGKRHEQVTQELRLTGKVGTLVDFTVGGFYYHARDRGHFRVMIPTFQYDFLADDRSQNERSYFDFLPNLPDHLVLPRLDILLHPRLREALPMS